MVWGIRKRGAAESTCPRHPRVPGYACSAPRILPTPIMFMNTCKSRQDGGHPVSLIVAIIILCILHMCAPCPLKPDVFVSPEHFVAGPSIARPSSLLALRQPYGGQPPVLPAHYCALYARSTTVVTSPADTSQPNPFLTFHLTRRACFAQCEVVLGKCRPSLKKLHFDVLLR